MTKATQYRIRPAHPGAHLFEVECEVTRPDPGGQRFWLPAWIPGSYMIRDFARHIVEIDARDADGRVALTKLDKASWRCEPCTGPLTLRYRVYAWDLSVRGAHLDQTHGFFNGTSVFVAVDGREQAPCELEILPPGGEALSGWRVATGLPRAGAAPWGFGRYRAANYDALIDHPVEMGDFTIGDFIACGVPHHVVISGRHDCDMPRLCRDLVTICEHHIRLFGAPAPIDSYLFLVMAVGDGYGGLEHRNSTALMCNREDLPRIGHGGVGDGYRRFLGLCSHEYFHSWNVKRIKPAVFSPYRLTAESYTRQLWAFEGITAYYDDLSLTRSGLIPASSYLQLLGETITRVVRGSGRFKQSVAESSLDAWTRFYQQDENAPNAIVSYYTKGSLIALALDLIIRRGSDGQRSLDELMRRLWQRYGAGADGVPEGAIEGLAAELAGEPLDGFFARYLHGTEDPPLAELLEPLGIAYRLRPASGPDDKGGTAPATTAVTEGGGNQDPDPIAPIAPVTLGLRLAARGDEARVAAVFDDGPAQQAGIAAGDCLLAMDGLRLTRGNFEQRLGHHRPGRRLLLHGFRRDELMEFQPQVEATAADTCYLELDPEVDDATRQRRDAWLNSPH